MPVDERGNLCPDGGDAAIDAAPDLIVRSAKRRSTWLGHADLVGVRSTCQRGLFGRTFPDNRSPMGANYVATAALRTWLVQL